MAVEIPAQPAATTPLVNADGRTMHPDWYRFFAALIAFIRQEHP